MTWVFIGAGNMATSLIGGLVKGGATTDSIFVVDPDQQACDLAVNSLGVQARQSVLAVMDDLTNDLAAKPLGIVIAVKPHIVETACLSIAEALISRKPPDITSDATSSMPLIVSVAAGVRASSIQCWLPKSTPVVRCMPNTPALLGLGATALFATELCTDVHKDQATQLLKAAGLTLWVNNESCLDAVTALSGSGPAYFFYLIEHMVEAGVELGLERSAALDLATETAFGAASMARSRKQTPQVLRENVTSKGGTTAAALAVFNDHNTPDIVRSAMQAAYTRAVELGDDLAPEQSGA